MKTRSLVLLSVLFILLFADSAVACSCLRLTTCEAYKKTPSIFIALVTEIESSRAVDSSPLVHLSVEHAFKGINESKLTMLQGTNSGDCSFVFEKGARYLLYAWYSEDTKQFHTSICTRSRPIEYAADDLNYLRTLSTDDRSTRLSGLVVNQDYARVDGTPQPELLKGVKVTAEGESGQKFEAVTDDQGFYKIIGLPPDRYKVTANIPSYLSLARENQESIKIESEGCETIDFVTRTDGRISGVLRDSRGQPVPETDVNLMPIELINRLGERGVGSYATSDKTGRFEFKELPPGRYLLGVNLMSEPDGDIPFRRTFFPGVARLSAAKVLELGRGEKLRDYDFSLPPRLAVQTITGILVWQSGEPVTKGLISFKNTPNSTGGEDFDYADVDSQGRFTLKVLTGTKGWVHASVLIPVESGLDLMIAEPVRVIASSKVRPIRLVVSKKSGGGVKILP